MKKPSVSPPISALKTLKSLLTITIFTLGLTALYAWSGPTATPPLNNIEAPINVGILDQVKSSGLGITNLVADLVISGSRVQLGDSNDTCNSSTAGSIRYRSLSMEYCNGTEWKAIFAEKEPIQIPDSSDICKASTAGSMRYRAGAIEYCDGIEWKTMFAEKEPIQIVDSSDICSATTAGSVRYRSPLLLT